MAFTRFTQSSLTTGVGKYIDADAGRTPIPSVPTIGTATDGGTGTTVSVAFTPGYYPGNYYTVLSNPGSITATGNSSPITVSGLTTGTSYNFSVSATNNTGTSAYSAASNSVTPAVPPSFESIATVSAGGSSTVTFSSIPSTYKHLQIRFTARSNSGSGADDMFIRINGDTTASAYRKHYLQGNGSSPAANTASSSYWLVNDAVVGGTAGGSFFSVGVIDIPDYASTTKNKVSQAIWGKDENGLGIISMHSCLWLNTSAISSMTLYLSGGPTYASGSTFALYGIKGS